MHAVAGIRALGDLCCIQFAMETGPTAAGVVFAIGAEQEVAAADACIPAFFGMVAILPAEGRLGARLTGDAVLFGIKLCLPLLVALGNFFHSICHCNVSCRSEILSV